MTEDETVGWHHQLNGREMEQTAGDSEGQGNLVCFCPQDCRELSMTYRLNYNLEQRRSPGQQLASRG